MEGEINILDDYVISLSEVVCACLKFNRNILIQTINNDNIILVGNLGDESMAIDKKYILSAVLIIFLLNITPVLGYSLTGTWQANTGGGYYYFRQVGSQFWWLGEESDSYPNWCNVAYGTISGDTIRVNWADVPKGNIMNKGKLTINIVSNDYLEIVGNPSPFGASAFARV